MEATLDSDVFNKNPTEKIAAEKTTDELDDILDEVVNLAKAVKGQKPSLDNMVTTGEKTVEAII